MKNTTDTNFYFTPEQQEIICEYYNQDRNKLDFWQVCELLDKLIDEKCTELCKD